MSTKTMLIHVPVDEAEIVRGPAYKAEDLFLFMGLTREDKQLELDVILRTPASSHIFMRTLTITGITSMTHGRRGSDQITFVGIFAGQRVAGVYNLKSRKGSFHLAD